MSLHCIICVVLYPCFVFVLGLPRFYIVLTNLNDLINHGVFTSLLSALWLWSYLSILYFTMIFLF